MEFVEPFQYIFAGVWESLSRISPLASSFVCRGFLIKTFGMAYRPPPSFRKEPRANEKGNIFDVRFLSFPFLRFQKKCSQRGIREKKEYNFLLSRTLSVREKRDIKRSIEHKNEDLVCSPKKKKRIIEKTWRVSSRRSSELRSWRRSFQTFPYEREREKFVLQSRGKSGTR